MTDAPPTRQDAHRGAEPFDVRKVDLDILNSLTKYPSIPTYHALDPKNGNLTEQPMEFEGLVIGTEKIDGTNGRIISLPDGSYVIGSREELLYAKGDLIGNPSQGIVDALRPVAEALPPAGGGAICVYYLEVYGRKIGQAAKQYTGQGNVGARLFDVAVLDDHKDQFTWTRERISAWREAGGQRYLTESELWAEAGWCGLSLAPRLFTIAMADLPREIEPMSVWLEDRLPRTGCALDDSAAGRPEGIVLRSVNRSVIAKARFQDYERTIRRRERSGVSQ